MNRKKIIILLVVIVILTLAITSKNVFKNSNETTSKEHKTASNIETSTTDKKLVMIDNKLYYDTGKVSEAGPRCGVMDGRITSHTEENLIPTENNQSNFEGDYEYQYGLYGTIDFAIDNKWITFKPLNQSIDFLDPNFKIEIIKSGNKEVKITEYYKKDDEQTIYLVGIDEIYLINPNNKLTLKEFINKEKISSNYALTYLENKINFIKSYDDGGTGIYVDEGVSSKKGGYSNTGFKIIQCHTISENYDTYITLKDYDEHIGFRNGFCGSGNKLFIK